MQNCGSLTEVHGMDSAKLWELNCSARNGQCKIVGVPRYFGIEACTWLEITSVNKGAFFVCGGNFLLWIHFDKNNSQPQRGFLMTMRIIMIYL